MDRVSVWVKRYEKAENDLDRIHAAVLVNEGAGDQLQVIYEILEESGRKVP